MNRESGIANRESSVPLCRRAAVPPSVRAGCSVQGRLAGIGNRESSRLPCRRAVVPSCRREACSVQGRLAGIGNRESSGLLCRLAVLPFCRPAGLRPSASGVARRSHGTRWTLGAPRRADRRAEVHERLVEFPRSLAAPRKQALGKLPDAAFVHAVAPSSRWAVSAPSAPLPKDPPQHSRDIRVYCRRPSLIREARNGAGRVASHAREPHQRVGVIGNGTPVFAHDGACQPVQIRGAAVVTKSVPGGLYLRRPCVRERSDRGEAGEEARVVLRNALDLGLLQHELRDQHAIRVAGRTPRQLPSLLSEPLEQSPLEAQGVGREAGWHRTQHRSGIGNRESGSVRPGCHDSRFPIPDSRVCP
jgi:hypothetical protein